VTSGEKVRSIIASIMEGRAHGMPRKAGSKQEYIILNTGSGVQVGSSVVLLGVEGTLDAARKFVRGLGAAHPGKIVIAKRETVITRAPVIDLTESNESLIEKAKA
jgi:hypothetical protein